MKLEMLPGENGPTVYAAVTENNEVVWAYDNGTAARQGTYERPDGEAQIDQDRSLFMVSKRGSIIIVEAAGWYDIGFHFRFEVTIRDPDKAVILANELAGMMDAANDQVTP